MDRPPTLIINGAMTSLTPVIVPSKSYYLLIVILGTPSPNIVIHWPLPGMSIFEFRPLFSLAAENGTFPSVNALITGEKRERKMKKD